MKWKINLIYSKNFPTLMCICFLFHCFSVALPLVLTARAQIYEHRFIIFIYGSFCLRSFLSHFQHFSMSHAVLATLGNTVCFCLCSVLKAI